VGPAAVVADEFKAAGMPLEGGERPRRRLRPARPALALDKHAFPDWHPRRGELGAPRAFLFRRCTHLIEQLQGAPLEQDGEPHPGEAVSRKWEGPYGHAHAAGRYGAMSWPGPSKKRPQPDLLAPASDPNELRAERLTRVDKSRDTGPTKTKRYRQV
jgi:hypothetical protein